jgi:hypothetical protein
MNSLPREPEARGVVAGGRKTQPASMVEGGKILVALPCNAAPITGLDA